MESLRMKRGVLLTLLTMTLLLYSCDNSTEPTKDEPIVHEWETVLTADFWCSGLIEVPSSPGTLLLTGTQVNEVGIGGLHRSTDWGTTWTEVYDSVDFIYPSYIDCDPPRVYATAGIKYYSMNPVQSFDGGLTWSSITDTLPDLYPYESIYSVFSHPTDPLEIMLFSSFLPSMFGGRVWRTVNGGQEWSLDSTYYIASFNWIYRNPLQPGHIAATASGYFILSRDNGLTWNQLYSFGAKLGSVHFMDDQSEWIFTNNRVSMNESLDGGVTFTPTGEGLPEGVEINEFETYKDNLLAFVQLETAEDVLYEFDFETRLWSQWADTSWMGVSHLRVLGEYVFVVVNYGEFFTLDRY